MASATALQYPSHPQTYISSSSRFPRAPFSGAYSYGRHAAAFSPSPPPTLPTSRPAPATRLDSYESLDAGPGPGASAAAKSMADHHAKLHKKSSVTSSTSNSKAGRSRAASFNRSPSVASSDTLQAQHSIAKDRFKANLKKLTQQKSEPEDNTLDLSKTAEENEKRSGLGLYTQEPHSPVLARMSSTADFGSHSRNVSHASQYSATSGTFRPSAPFSIPMRHSPRPRTPPMASSYSTSVLGSGDAYGEGLSNLSHEVTFEANEPSPPERQWPPLRLNTAGSDSSARFGFTSAYATTSQTNIASTSLRSAPLPRRNTNQSTDTAPTPKSRTSMDRAFSFMTRTTSGAEREEPLDPITRAASIQAARQAFQEKEDAKAKKYERREERAAERARRKSEGKGLGRKSDGKGLGRSVGSLGLQVRKTAGGGARTTPTTATASTMATNDSRTATIASRAAAGEKASGATVQRGTRYLDMPAGPAPEKGGVSSQEGRRQERKYRPTKAKTVKNRYLRFLSWLRTKLLNIGGGRRR